MSKPPVYAGTGTGAERRRLTTDEAVRGVLPEPFTTAEWRAAKETVDQLDVAMRQARERAVQERAE